MAQVTVTGTEIQGQLKEPLEQPPAEGQEEPTPVISFVTYLPSFGDDRLLSLLETQEVRVETRPEADVSWLAILLNFLPFLLLLWLGYLFFRQMSTQGQRIFNVGKSRAKLYERREERTTFDDVAGVRGAKTELQEIVEFLKDPHQVQRLGGEAPTGILLVGPPRPALSSSTS